MTSKANSTNKTKEHNKNRLNRSGSLNKYFFGTGEESEEKKEENHQFDENHVDRNDIEEYVSINIEETELLYHFLDASNNEVTYLENSNYIRDEMKFLNSFSKFSETINDAFIGKRAYNSITLDLIALYLKGQKILYVESKTYCEQCLYFIMLPTIFISSACTVLSITLGFYEYGSTIVSTLTAFNSFMLALITYLKLDAKSGAHKTSAYQFDKLESTCEFLSGKVLLMRDDKLIQEVGEFVESVQKKVEEIKDTNQFIIPEIIRSRYSNIYSHNVFAIVKKFRTKFLLDKNRLFLIYQEINRQQPMVRKELIEEKNRILSNLIKFRNIALEINQKVYHEIEYFNHARNSRTSMCMWLKT
jgi:hypothetical protein